MGVANGNVGNSHMVFNFLWSLSFPARLSSNAAAFWCGLQMEVGGHLRLAQPSWIGSHLRLVAILDWWPTWIGRSNFPIDNFPIVYNIPISPVSNFPISPISNKLLKDAGWEGSQGLGLRVFTICNFPISNFPISNFLISPNCSRMRDMRVSRMRVRAEKDLKDKGYGWEGPKGFPVGKKVPREKVPRKKVPG